MKKIIVLLVVALAIPTSVAFAKAPQATATHGKSHATVMYILKGTFTAFTPASSAGDGSITINVTHSNFHAKALRGPMQFAVASNTRITFVNGTTTLGPNAKGMVKFRAPLHPTLATGATLATALPTMVKAFHVIIQNG